MAEIYDNSPPKQPKQIDVAARLIDEAGRDAFASRDVLANGEGGAPKWQTFGYTGRIPLEGHSRRGDICCGSKRTIAAPHRGNLRPRKRSLR